MQVQVFYIVQFPMPPPLALVWRSVHNPVTANLGPQSGVQVLCGVVVNNAIDMEVE